MGLQLYCTYEGPLLKAFLVPRSRAYSSKNGSGKERERNMLKRGRRLEGFAEKREEKFKHYQQLKDANQSQKLCLKL